MNCKFVAEIGRTNSLTLGGGPGVHTLALTVAEAVPAGAYVVVVIGCYKKNPLRPFSAGGLVTGDSRGNTWFADLYGQGLLYREVSISVSVLTTALQVGDTIDIAVNDDPSDLEDAAAVAFYFSGASRSRARTSPGSASSLQSAYVQGGEAPASDASLEFGDLGREVETAIYGGWMVDSSVRSLTPPAGLNGLDPITLAGQTGAGYQLFPVYGVIAPMVPWSPTAVADVTPADWCASLGLAVAYVDELAVVETATGQVVRAVLQDNNVLVERLDDAEPPGVEETLSIRALHDTIYTDLWATSEGTLGLALNAGFPGGVAQLITGTSRDGGRTWTFSSGVAPAIVQQKTVTHEARGLTVPFRLREHATALDPNSLATDARRGLAPVRRRDGSLEVAYRDTSGDVQVVRCRALSKALAGSWSGAGSINGPYQDVSRVLDERRGLSVVALWKETEEAWYWCVGTLDGSGNWNHSAPALLVENAQRGGKLLRRRDGRIEFHYLDNSTGARGRLVARDLSAAGSGSWS